MTDRWRGSSVGLRLAAWIGWMRYFPPLPIGETDGYPPLKRVMDLLTGVPDPGVWTCPSFQRRWWYG